MQAEQQSERERFDHLVSGQAQNLIGALIAHGLLQKSLPEELYLKLWEVVEQQLHAVNREGARAALSHPSPQASLSVESLKALEKYLMHQPLSNGLLERLHDVRCALKGWPPAPQTPEIQP